jgi:hypothetical protein
MIKIEESCLSTFKQNILASIDSVVQQTDGVTYIWLQTLCVFNEVGNDLFNIKSVAASMNNVDAFGSRSFAYLFRERLQVNARTNANSDSAGFVGVCRSDALERRPNLVIPQVAFRDRVPRLVPRENQLSLTRDLEFCARNSARLESVNLCKQCRHVNDDAITNDRSDVVVQNPRRNELQGVLLSTDNHGVTGVVSTLIASDNRILSGKKVDDLGFAFIAPLGSDDDGD